MNTFFLMFTLLLMTACSKNSSQEQAEKIVIKENSNHNGTAKIIDVKKENKNFIITWENKDNLSKGVDLIDSDGNIKIIEATVE